MRCCVEKYKAREEDAPPLITLGCSGSLLEVSDAKRDLPGPEPSKDADDGRLAQSSTASVCGGQTGGLQCPPGHLQGSILGLVPANKSRRMDEDTAFDPAELRQRLVSNAAPLFQQGQPTTGT